jgi:hypothetical protein
MPLSELQRRVLKVIARNRNPESYVAGASVLQRDGMRLSNDIDIFQDREDRVKAAADHDVATLEAAGFNIRWVRREGTFFRAMAGDETDETRLEWVLDSDFRFLPAIPDEEFGYILHPVDLATNKILAAADRFEVRDAIDLLWIDDRIQPLGAVAWAAVDKNPGWTPEGILAEVKAKARYRDDQLESEMLTVPLTAADLNRQLRERIARAERLVAMLPSSLGFGLLLASDGSLAQPDPDRPETLQGLVVHHGSRKGAWPSSPEISSLMLRRGHPADR